MAAPLRFCQSQLTRRTCPTGGMCQLSHLDDDFPDGTMIPHDVLEDFRETCKRKLRALPKERRFAMVKDLSQHINLCTKSDKSELMPLVATLADHLKYLPVQSLSHDMRICLNYFLTNVIAEEGIEGA